MNAQSLTSGNSSMDTLEGREISSVSLGNKVSNPAIGGLHVKSLMGLSYLMTSTIRSGDHPSLGETNHELLNPEIKHFVSEGIYSTSQHSNQELIKSTPAPSQDEPSLIHLLSLYPIQITLVSHLTTADFLALSDTNFVIGSLLSAPVLPLKQLYTIADRPDSQTISLGVCALTGYSIFASTMPYENGIAKRDIYHSINPHLPTAGYFYTLLKRTRRGCSCATIPSRTHSYPSVRNALGDFPVEMDCSKCGTSVCFACWWNRTCTTYKDEEGWGLTRQVCKGCMPTLPAPGDLDHCKCGVQILCNACDADINRGDEDHGAHFLDKDGGLRKDLIEFLDPDRAWSDIRMCRGCRKPRTEDDEFDRILQMLKEEGTRKIYRDRYGGLHVATDYFIQ